MLLAPLLHGSSGYLDELVAVGIVLAIGLVIYFVFALFGSKAKPAQKKHEKE